MTIRKAFDSDRDPILSLIKRFPDKLVQEHLPEIEEFFVATEKNSSTDSTGSQQAGSERVVGCCALEVYSERLAEIRSLAVLPEMQGKGIATTLIDACLAEAKEKKIYEVLTITSSMGLFEKKGFGTFNNEKYALFKVLEK